MTIFLVMTSLLETREGFSWLSSASIVEEDRELAWAQPFVRRADDIRWVLGNFVQTSTPELEQANQNGHIFPLSDTRNSILDLPHRPLNYLHIPNRRVGTFTAAELVYPDQGKIEEDASIVGVAPQVEALACYWLYYDDGLWQGIERAYKDGDLFFSMEAVPEQITCANCRKLYDYDGPYSQLYCDHLREKRSKKILHRPHFLAGALIVPPVKPGWRGANVKEISQLLEADTDLTEALYHEVAAATQTLTDAQIENVLYFLLLKS